MNEQVAREGEYYCSKCEEKTNFTYKWTRRTVTQTLNFEKASATYDLTCDDCNTPLSEY